MKKYVMPFVIFIGLAATSGAQTIVPAAVKASFAKEFKGSSAKWEKEGQKYEANFKQMGHDMSALFMSDGTLTETEMEIKVGELPASVREYVQVNHKGAVIKEAAKITKANGVINYEAEVNGKDLLFDVNGKYLEEGKND